MEKSGIKKRRSRHDKDLITSSDMADSTRNVVDHRKSLDPNQLEHTIDTKVQAKAEVALGAVKKGQAMSSHMQAVMRLMTGQEERTIAEKMADSNRPTWEEYKKVNQDKLDISGFDRKQMEEYRRDLDRERERILRRGRNHSDKKHKRRQNTDSDSESESDSQSTSNKSKRKSRSKKHKKSRRSDKSDRVDKKHRASCKENNGSHKYRDKCSAQENDAFRLSSFFNHESDSD